ncbi:MAG TPA: hypothetical protein VHW60_19560 [Caulobacteraceae bacterium]|jgi:hypothetical protein|nr:hypothetical protein [Caulobacteraceae bacterium]
MSVSHAKPRPERPAHVFSPTEILIFAAGLLVAVLVGVTATGGLPT